VTKGQGLLGKMFPDQSGEERGHNWVTGGGRASRATKMYLCKGIQLIRGG